MKLAIRENHVDDAQKEYANVFKQNLVIHSYSGCECRKSLQMTQQWSSAPKKLRIQKIALERSCVDNCNIIIVFYSL